MTDNEGKVPDMNIDNPVSADAEAVAEQARENRTLKWKLKTLGKQLGKQGQRIFELRNENAALREGREVKMGDYLNLLRQFRDATKEIRRLQGLLDALDDPISYLPVQNEDCIGESVKVGDNLYAQTPAQAKAVEEFINHGTTSPDAGKAYL